MWAVWTKQSIRTASAQCFSTSIFVTFTFFARCGNMKEVEFDSAKYFTRIGVNPQEENQHPTLELLESILLSHMQAIPFENLDVAVMKKTVSMKLGDVADKLVENQRGGYCFEHNVLLAAALRAVGYTVTTMLARVLWNKKDIPSHQHVVLVVKVGADEYLVDAAFGGVGSIAPLRMDTEKSQQTDALYRITKNPNNYCTLQIFSATKNEWVSMYTIRCEEASVNDMEMSNWWTCTHSDALLSQCLVIARVIDGERHSLHNAGYKIHRIRDGTSTVSTIDTAEEWLGLVSSVFGIPVESFPDQALLRKRCEHFMRKDSRHTPRRHTS